MMPEIERALISAVMQHEMACVDCEAAGVTQDYFKDPRHRIIYREIMAGRKNGTPFDLILFTAHMEKTGHLQTIGGAQYLTETYSLTCHNPMTSTAPYISMVIEQYKKRKAMEICSRAVSRNDDTPIRTVMEQLSAIEQIRCEQTPSIKDSVYAHLHRMESSEPAKDIIRTGLDVLDKKSILRRGDMPLITGQRKTGKSILALNLARNIASANVPVLYFSLEDREPKIMERLFSLVSHIPMQSAHTSRLSEAQVRRALDSASLISQWPMTIFDDTFELTEICGKIKHYAARNMAHVAFIDYAQLICVSKGASGERRLDIEKISRDLRKLAMQEKVAIILLAQLNKQGETRESKALEMDATACWEIQEIDDDPASRIILIPFQRNGESRIMFKIRFNGPIAGIENLEQSF